MGGSPTGHATVAAALSIEFKAQLLVKGLYAAALGIEILCITAAEIGENTGLYLFGFNPWNSYRICYGIHPCWFYHIHYDSR
jgi:hypothetical protein